MNRRYAALAAVSTPIAVYWAWRHRKISPPKKSAKDISTHNCLPASKKLMLIGDSRIANWTSDSFPNCIDVASRGRGGEFLHELAERLPSEINCLHPSSILIQSGINDLVAASLSNSHDAKRIFAAAMKAITRAIQVCQDHAINCYPSTVIPPSSAGGFYVVAGVDKIATLTKEFNLAVTRLAALHGVQLLDFANTLSSKSDPLLTDEMYRTDTLHLNAIAYKRLANVLCRELPLSERHVIEHQRS